ncbi:hypothetical protein GCM10009527_094950 [Actinomadura nitritigenes]|uniref:Lipoprotein n=1 Tax=Actinomadura nitritigenes TaxID=134602 RepID=A0ABS3QQT8_9ACTN|nr:hypothetical protein [Actinomadura nitritigenes]MBO2436348.1 hypothetical protein [Actinomadura nitritigenes]
MTRNLKDGSRKKVFLCIACGGLLIPIALIALWLQPWQSHKQATSTPRKVSSPAAAVLSSDGLVLQLPEAGDILRKSLPASAADLKENPDPFNNLRQELYYTWQSFAADRSRFLSVRIHRLASRKEAEQAYTYKLQHSQRDHSKAKGDGGANTGAATSISNMGDAAFSLPISQKMTGNTYDDNRKYDVHGTYLYCRTKNVTIEVFWEGAQTSSASSEHSAPTSDIFSYAQTTRDARNIVASVVRAME